MAMPTDALASTDVIVVGAGIAGVCTAFELRRRAFDVVLVEQRFPAFGSSGRSAGAVWLQSRRAGDELALARAGKAKYEEYRELVGDTFDYRVNGGLFFFETEAQGAVLERYAADRAANGLSAELVSLLDAHKLSPLVPDTAIGAVYCAEDAQIDGQAFVGAMTNACVRAGVRKYENTAVLSTLRDGDRVIGVRTVRGDILAAGVVWATGAWAKNLSADGIDLPMTTARMGNVLTQPIEQGTSAVLRGPRGVAGCSALHDVPGFDPSDFAPPFDPAGDGAGRVGAGGLVDADDYITSNTSGQFYVGGTIDGIGSLNPHISARATNAMLQGFVERYPRYADFGVTGLWAGLTSDTPDHLPLVGSVDGLYVNVGHAWGIASGPICGQVLAEQIAGERSPFSEALRVDRAALAGAPEPDR